MNFASSDILGDASERHEALNQAEKP